MEAQSIFSDLELFLDEIFKKINNAGISTEFLKIDHVGYQSSTLADLEIRKRELEKEGTKILESIVGDKRVVIFSLRKSIVCRNQTISVVEIVLSLKDPLARSGWEHVEIVPEVELEKFINKYPTVSWDTRAIDRDIYPMLVLKLDDHTRVKFPRYPVLVEAKRIKNNRQRPNKTNNSFVTNCKT